MGEKIGLILILFIVFYVILISFLISLLTLLGGLHLITKNEIILKIMNFTVEILDILSFTTNPKKK